MKNILHTLLVCGVVMAAAEAAAGGDAASQLQSWKLTDLAGNSFSLTENRGQVTVVNFWASWCPPCLKELPVLNAWHEDWSGRGARVAAISIDSNEKKARNFVEKADLKLDVYHDGPDGLARQLDLDSLPCTFVLDQEGRVALISNGSSDEDLERVRRTVEGLLGTSAAADAPSTGAGR